MAKLVIGKVYCPKCNTTLGYFGYFQKGRGREFTDHKEVCANCNPHRRHNRHLLPTPEAAKTAALAARATSCPLKKKKK